MKQYRLKITWSNGDSFSAQDKENLWNDMKVFMDLRCIISIDNKHINLEHVRSIELEEYIPETEVRF